nr:helix-turn-helix transcriptional regulator [uncultured Roseateles sp.]
MSEPANIPPDENLQLAEEAPFKPAPMRAPVGESPESLLGRRLGVARAHYRLTVEALSRLVKGLDSTGKGISPPSIARYEAGENLPGVRELRLLCDALDVTPKWLIYGELDVSGKSDAEQLLLSALRRVIAESNPEFALGGIVDTTIEFHRKRERAQRLAEARKPAQ